MNVERGGCESLEASEVQNAESGWGSPEPRGRNPSVFALGSSSRHARGIINKTCANSSTHMALTGKGKKAKGVKETKERFSNFPFLFSPLSLSTLTGLSVRGWRRSGARARSLLAAWLG